MYRITLGRKSVIKLYEYNNHIRFGVLISTTKGTRASHLCYFWCLDILIRGRKYLPGSLPFGTKILRHEAKSKIMNNNMETQQEDKNELAVLKTLMSCAPVSIKGAQQVVFETTCETLSLVSLQVARRIQVALHENVVKRHACMTVEKAWMFTRAELSVISSQIFAWLTFTCPSTKIIDDVTSVPEKIVRPRHRSVSYPSYTTATKLDSFVNAVD